MAFAGGVIAAHLQPLPDYGAWVAAASGALWLALRLWPAGAALAFGVAWGSLAAHAAMPQRPTHQPASANLTLTVVGLPTQQGPALRFEGIVAAPASGGLRPGDRVRLSWATPPVAEVRPGQRWLLSAKVRRARGGANPHAFDYERWLTRHRIVATGYVSAGALLADSRHPIHDFRLRLRERVAELELPHGGMALALATGDGALLAPEVWDRFRETGTVHLLVISGLHIGMFAALGMGLGNLLGRATPLTRRFRARSAGSALAIVSALAYATLAGWTLPVTRATTMACIGALAAASGRRVATATTLAAALALVLAMDPLAPLDTGFWLSFLAVAGLLAFFAPRAARAAEPDVPAPLAGGAGRRSRPRWLARAAALVLAQLVVWIVFAPALGIFVGHVHPLSPVINLVLIPVVTIAAAPLSALGVMMLPLLPWLGETLLSLANGALGFVAWVVEQTAGIGGMAVDARAAPRAAAVALALAFLLPWPTLTRAGLAATMFAALTGSQRAPVEGFEVTALDVGQGTSLLVRTAEHSLLYDAGARFPSGFDIGEAVVAPHVLAVHGRKVTELVLSHADIDHVGGAQAILRRLDVRGVSAGEPVPGIGARPCRGGDAWLWDGVRFRVLWPVAPQEGNNASCVIEVAAGERRALLAGDIEGTVERQLTLRPVDLLVAPHHGSRTSSTVGFAQRLSPRVVIFSAAFHNRFGHPHADVVERYRDAGAHLASTAELGAIVWRSATPGLLAATRDDWRYWRRGRLRMAP